MEAIIATTLILLTVGWFMSFALRLLVPYIWAMFTDSPIEAKVIGLKECKSNFDFVKYAYVFSYKDPETEEGEKAVNLIPQKWINELLLGKTLNVYRNPFKKNSVIAANGMINISVSVFYILLSLITGYAFHNIFHIPININTFFVLLLCSSIGFLILWIKKVDLEITKNDFIPADQVKSSVHNPKSTILDKQGLKKHFYFFLVLSMFGAAICFTMLYKIQPVVKYGKHYTVTVADIQQNNNKYGGQKRPIVEFMSEADGLVNTLVKFPYYFSMPYKVGDKIQAKCFEDIKRLRAINLQRGMMTKTSRCVIFNSQTYVVIGFSLLFGIFPFLRMEKHIF